MFPTFLDVFFSQFSGPLQKSLFTVCCSILAPFWIPIGAKMGAKAPHAGPELDMLFTVYAPHGPLQGTPGFGTFSGSCPEGGLGDHFSCFLAIFDDFWGPFGS